MNDVERAFSELRNALEQTAPRIAKTMPPPPMPMQATELLAQAAEYELEASRKLARAADLRAAAKRLSGDVD